MAAISTEHVTKSFGTVTVLNDISAEFEDGQYITLLGPSGCGKTTLLRMIAGFEKPSSGVIRIGGEPVSSPSEFVPPERRNIGMVFQSYAVWPHMNVFDNVAYPLKIRQLPKDQIREKVEGILESVHLSQYAERMPAELSGGQQQRVALGRALIAEPGVLLLDEPLSNLDAKLREEMQFELKEIQKKFGITVVHVTHDQREAMTMSDRIYVIYSGKIQQEGSPVEIYCRPKNQFVADFIGKVNMLKGTASEGVIRLDGSGETLTYGGPLSGRVDVAVRPENIHITEDGSHLNGMLRSVFFEGEECECRVQAGGSELKLKAEADFLRKHRAGENVGLRISDFLVFPEGGEESRRILT